MSELALVVGAELEAVGVGVLERRLSESEELEQPARRRTVAERTAIVGAIFV